MQIELKRLQTETGITFVFVTHDQEEALTMSDRIAVMDQGHILQIGAPTEIYEHPQRHFVADFIGETNFLQGRIEIAGSAAMARLRSEEHTSELQSLMRISYAGFCWKKKKHNKQ